MYNGVRMRLMEFRLSELQIQQALNGESVYICDVPKGAVVDFNIAGPALLVEYPDTALDAEIIG